MGRLRQLHPLAVSLSQMRQCPKRKLLLMKIFAEARGELKRLIIYSVMPVSKSICSLVDMYL